MSQDKKPAKELFDLSGKVVVLTGAAGLLGTEYAEALSEAGASVVLADINEERCNSLAKELGSKFDTSPMSISLDLNGKSSVERMVDTVVSKYSKIDILINNAVCNPLTEDFHAPFEEFSLENWDKVIAVNMTGVFLCCQAAGSQMVKQGYGNIINISSTYGLVGADQRIYGDSGINSSIVYAATKAAVLNMTRYLAAYWEGKNIRVNTLSPGGVYNNQADEFVKNYSYRTILGRMAEKHEYRGAILFLASDASSYMTGANLVVDGGWTAW